MITPTTTGPPSYHELVVTAISEPVTGFRLFTLDNVSGQPIPYRAGQYLTLVGNSHHTEIRRSYSMISAPVLGEPLTIGVKRIVNGVFSRFLFALHEGARLRASGTGGFFTLPDDAAAIGRFIFFAAGAGITPIYSILKTLLARQPLARVLLVYSSPSEKQTVFFQEILDLQTAHANFHIEWLFSDHHDLLRARLSAELLFTLLAVHHIHPGGSLFYVCGPEAYMRMCFFALREAGIDEENIRRENFFTPVAKRVSFIPPDTGRHEVVLDLGHKMAALSVQYPRSILDTALDAGIPLPFSCKAGICGNCAARCVTGAIWMSNNDVLTGRELKDGIILTCTGFPVYGDALLRIG